MTGSTRMICTEDGDEIRPATAEEIMESDRTAEGWLRVSDVSARVYVDGEPPVYLTKGH